MDHESCLRVAVTFLCRLFPGATVGDGVYGDEYGDFECVTTQPGCKQACYNLFAPMSHPRFYTMQVLFLCFPSMLFAMIATNMNAKYEMVKARVDRKAENDSNSDYVTTGKYDKDVNYLKKFKTKTVSILYTTIL